MKTKRVNSIIFIISAIVFLLQVVGYFAPAWFVQEVAVKPDSKGIRADGRRFELPYLQNIEDLDKPDHAKSGGDCTEMREDIPAPEGNENVLPRNDKSRRKRVIPQQISNTESEKTLQKTTLKGEGTTVQPKHKVKKPIVLTIPEATKTDQESNKGSTIYPAGKGKPTLLKDIHDTATQPSTDWNKNRDEFEANKDDKTHKEQRFGNEKQFLYLTAGLWYSRACITTRNPKSEDGGIAGMQWCTLYTRFDDNTLEKKQNMFELRLEATFGIVLSALSLLISSTACCSNRHHGRRAVSSLTSLFVSGAVTAIPVVHIIIQHVQIHEKIVRTRKWMHLTKMMHVQHDLFDHYSVILCGVASLVSVLSAFIFTLVSCRSNSKPDNWYDLKHVTERKESKHELPINWVHNNKITVPQVSEIKDETRDDSESGYSEVKDEYTASGNDAGAAENDLDHLEFDSKEMKTFDM
ncbi:uncharacterized protein LOC123549253 [Mercenaria mercenaria]|uniref:uncharacterized protein LOC123549253 n=1 Tax=Mercenaria mercenaria TaxID=6596 RepID=UPI00234F2274|nr:uncharacterized protein LOC123549253 [Mercenaria mercenaria]